MILSGLTIKVGYTGENNTRTHVFHLTDELARYPGLTPVLKIKRPGEDTWYHPANTRLDGEELTWTFDLYDNGIKGQGEGQLVFVGDNGQQVYKTAIFRTNVLQAIDGAEASPEWSESLEQRITADIAKVYDGVEQGKQETARAADQADRATEQANQAKVNQASAKASADAAAGSLKTLREGITSGNFKGEKGDTGERGPQGETGARGPAGKDGRTPVKGVDYYTDADIKAIANDVTQMAKPHVTAAQTAEKNAKASETAAAGSASTAAASKDAAEKSAAAAKESEAKAKASEEAAAASATEAQKSKEAVDGVLEVASGHAKNAGDSAEKSEASAARAEAAAQTALEIIDDKKSGIDKTWSSQRLIERLAVPFEKSGNPVQCYPVEGSPISVQTKVQPHQHFDWVKCQAKTTQATTEGVNILPYPYASKLGKSPYGPDLSGGKGSVTISGTAPSSFNYAFQDETGFFLEAGTYTIALWTEPAFNQVNLLVYDGKKLLAYGTSPTFTIQERTGVRVYLNSGSPVEFGDGVVFYPMLVRGDKKPEKFEIYTGGKAAPSPDYPQSLEDSISRGNYYIPSTAEEGGYWRIEVAEALGGIGDRCDSVEIDAYTGKYRIVRNTKRITLDETVGWKSRPVNYPNQYMFSEIKNGESVRVMDGLCSHYQTLDASDKGGINSGYAVTGVYLRFTYSIIVADERQTTMKEYVDFLTSQKEIGMPVDVRYSMASPDVTIGQATLVTSIDGLKALPVQSMGLTNPDAAHSCTVTVHKNVELYQLGTSLVPDSEIFAINELVHTVAGTVDQKVLFNGLPTLRTERAWMGYKINLKEVLKKYPIPDGTWLTYSIWVKTMTKPAKDVQYCFYTTPTMDTVHFDYKVSVDGNYPLQYNKVFRVPQDESMTWHRASVKFKVNEDVRKLNIFRFEADYYDSDKYGQKVPVYFAAPKLEIGEQPTAFSTFKLQQFSTQEVEEFYGGVINLTAEKSGYDKKVVLTGEEYLWQTSGANAGALVISSQAPNPDNTECLSTHFPYLYAYSGSGIFIDSENIVIGRATGKNKSVAEWKEFFKTEYEAGHPVTVYYRSKDYSLENDVPAASIRFDWVKTVLDGETIKFNESENGMYWNLPQKSIANYGEKLFCTHLTRLGINLTYQFAFLMTNSEEQKNGFETVDELNAFLVEQNKAGTPVTMYFKRSTPQILAMPIISMSALSGTNTLITNADEMTVTGYSDPIRIITNLTERIAALENATTK